jgi:release factor glutamine methyltransferase
MLPTPSLGAIDFDKVYEPAEDTYLFLDALEADAEFLKKAKPSLCVEIGSGSGLVMTFLAKILGPSAASFIGIDINPDANLGTVATGLANNVIIDPIRTCLTDGLRLNGKVDVLLFNPPYVPTKEIPTNDQRKIANANAEQLLECSWSGGPDGRFWIDILMPRIAGLLSPSGCFIMILVKENRPDEICQWAQQAFGLRSKVLRDRKARNEHLFAVKFYK